eukprot:10197707-Heterocapsa_arctica.AAC.1
MEDFTLQSANIVETSKEEGAARDMKKGERNEETMPVVVMQEELPPHRTCMKKKSGRQLTRGDVPAECMNKECIMQSKGWGQAVDGSDIRHQEEHSSREVCGDEEKHTVQGLDSTTEAGRAQCLDDDDGSGGEKGIVGNGGNENVKKTCTGAFAEQRNFEVHLRNHGREQ